MTLGEAKILKKLEELIEDTERRKEDAVEKEDHLESMFCIGRINGLLWAKAIILNYEGKLEEGIK